MKQSVPARGRHESLSARGSRVDLRIRYYSKVKPQRVYPLMVEVPRGGAATAAGTESLVLRPVIPGALVTPGEQRLDPGQVGSQATFFVTPLARGRLPRPQVEVLQHGRLVEAVPLRIKGVTQRLTWWLLLLTLLLPATLLYITRYNPLTGNIPVTHVRPAGAEEGEGEDHKAPHERGAGEGERSRRGEEGRAAEKEGRAEGEKARDDEKEKAPQEGDKAGPGGRPQPIRGPGGRMGAGGPAGGGAAPPADLPGTYTVMMPGSPGEVLEYRLNRFLQENTPAIPEVSSKVNPVVTHALGTAYGTLAEGGFVLDMQPSFWLAVVLLALTLLSWLLHASHRTSRRATLHLASTSASLETLPLNAGIAAIPAEPVD